MSAFGNKLQTFIRGVADTAPSRVRISDLDIAHAHGALLVADQIVCDALSLGEPVIPPRLSVETAKAIQEQALADYARLLVLRGGDVELIDV